MNTPNDLPADLAALLPPEGPERVAMLSDLADLLRERAEARRQREAEAERMFQPSGDDWLEEQLQAERRRQNDAKRRWREAVALYRTWGLSAPNPAEDRAARAAWEARRNEQVFRPREQAAKLRGEARAARVLGSSTKAVGLEREAARLESMAANNEPSFAEDPPRIFAPEDRRRWLEAKLEVTPPTLIDELVAAHRGVAVEALPLDSRAIAYSEARGEATLLSGRTVRLSSGRPDLAKADRDFSFEDRARAGGWIG